MTLLLTIGTHAADAARNIILYHTFTYEQELAVPCQNSLPHAISKVMSALEYLIVQLA